MRWRTGPAGAHTQQNWLPALAILVVGMVMSVLDVSIVNVASPPSYTLTPGVVVPISGWLGDRVGLRRAYPVAARFRGRLGALRGGRRPGQHGGIRVLQGIPGGLLPVITLTMLRRIVPPAKLGAAMGVYGLGVVFAPAVGPPEELDAQASAATNLVRRVGSALLLPVLTTVADLPIYQWAELATMATSYGPLSLIQTVVTALSVPLALFLTAPSGSTRAAVPE
ncbi:MAG TPA: MFS transporter [Pseudonocardia sp.]